MDHNIQMRPCILCTFSTTIPKKERKNAVTISPNEQEGGPKSIPGALIWRSGYADVVAFPVGVPANAVGW